MSVYLHGPPKNFTQTLSLHFPSHGQPISHLLSQYSSWQENTLKQKSVIKNENSQKAFLIPAAALNFALTDFILDYIG